MNPACAIVLLHTVVVVVSYNPIVLVFLRVVCVPGSAVFPARWVKEIKYGTEQKEGVV